jgi:hypothetical protein
MAETVDLSESRQTEVLIVAWVTTGTAILTVAIKLFARAKIIRVIGWDDFFIFTHLRYSASSLRLSCTMEWSWDSVDIRQLLPQNLAMSDSLVAQWSRCWVIVLSPYLQSAVRVS